MPPAAIAIGGAVIGGATKLLSAKKQAKAARKAGELQTATAGRAAGVIGGGLEGQLAELRESEAASIAEQQRQFDIGLEFGEPRREAETAALNELRNVLGLDGERDFSAFEGGPGFAFTRDEALQATERSAAARGGLVSGNTFTALQDRAAGLASQNFLQTFLNPLTQLAGGGANAAAQQQQMGLGANIGRTLAAGGTNRASSIAGGALQQANILTGGAVGQGNALLAQGQAQAGGIEGLGGAIGGGLEDILVILEQQRRQEEANKGFGGEFVSPVNAFRG